VFALPNASPRFRRRLRETGAPLKEIAGANHLCKAFRGNTT